MANLKINPQEYISATNSYNQMYFRGYNGYNVYSYSYSNGIHTLTGFGDYIQFTPTQAFSSSNTFVVNGTSVTAKTQDGEALSDGYFASGTVVTCILNGATLNFKSGGTALNFKVVGGVSQPSNPVENTLWVNTSVAIGEWLVDSQAPAVRADGSSLQTGDIWVQNLEHGNVSVQALKKNGIRFYPASAKQWNGTAWANVDAEVYQNGTWSGLMLTFFPASSTNKFTVVKSNDGVQTSLTIDSSGYLEFIVGGSSSGSGLATFYTDAIDVTEYSILKIKAISNYSNSNAGIATTNTSYFPSGAGHTMISQVYISAAPVVMTEYTLDVSSVTGVVYPYVCQSSYFQDAKYVKVESWTMEV